MDFLKNNKKLVLIIVILFLLFFIIVILDRKSVEGYVLISNDHDMIKEVNEDFLIIEEQDMSLDMVYNLSSSFIMGYRYLYQIQNVGIIEIDKLTKEEQAQLVYLFATSGESSVCFSKKYFRELVYRYLGISNFKVKFDKDEYYGKNNFFHGYCFEQYFVDAISEFVFETYERDEENLIFIYSEESDGDLTKRWNIVFKEKDGKYFLKSLSVE